MALEFDPNNPAKQKNRPVWATYIPGRKGPKFKQHSDRGKALNALSMGYGILYHWERVYPDGPYEMREARGEEKWVEVARSEGPEPEVCDRCGGDFTVESYGRTYHSYHTLWIGKPKLRHVTVCRECEYAILYPEIKGRFPRDDDKWYSKYNRSNKRKVDDREL